MNNKLYPGKQNSSELWAVVPERIERYMNNHVIPFLRLPENAVCLDVGEANPRMDYMKKKLNLNVEQWDTQDLNFDSIQKKNHYDIIFCFDLLEHIQNPLWLMKQMKDGIKDSGSIYINLPENAQWLWGEEHFFEYRFGHFAKWLIIPSGLKTVRQKKIFFIANWKAFLIGIRPLLRILRRETTLRSMARSMFCWNFRIYELKKSE
jgi:2-polyprenyl-3-methyl-5-hydroxy-6-metoxy-1,4-benzoquinol methylase